MWYTFWNLIAVISFLMKEWTLLFSTAHAILVSPYQWLYNFYSHCSSSIVYKLLLHMFLWNHLIGWLKQDSHHLKPLLITERKDLSQAKYFLERIPLILQTAGQFSFQSIFFSHIFWKKPKYDRKKPQKYFHHYRPISAIFFLLFFLRFFLLFFEKHFERKYGQ